MRLALEWAAKGMYITAPNPRVGCVIVKDGVVIGAGHTQPPGQAHAEIQALRDAEARGADVRGATAYVTLEPCSHFGRTPPCADALVKAGLARVVAAVSDPNPLVAGQGFARLQAAGIATECGVLEKEARELNIGFFSRMQRGKPWVRMKVASSLDGKTALYNGKSQWITSPEARADGHLWRARAGAILSGIGTVRVDNPQLNVRGVEKVVVNLPRQPIRIVVDRDMELDPAARVLDGGGTLVIVARRDPEKEAALVERGAEIIELPNAHGKVDLPALMQELGRRQINELHLESGFKLNGSMIREGCVDELLLYMAPDLLGAAQGMFELPAIEDLEQRHHLRFHDARMVGPDLRVLARFTKE